MPAIRAVTILNSSIEKQSELAGTENASNNQLLPIWPGLNNPPFPDEKTWSQTCRGQLSPWLQHTQAVNYSSAYWRWQSDKARRTPSSANKRCHLNVIQLNTVQTSATFWYPVHKHRKHKRWQGARPCRSAVPPFNVLDLMPGAALAQSVQQTNGNIQLQSLKEREKESETLKKRESPRALRGRSEKCRQMLEDVPEVFSVLQCVILSHQAEREREKAQQ